MSYNIASNQAINIDKTFRNISDKKLKSNLTTDDVSKLEEYLKEVREPTAEEMVDLSIIGEVKLVYKDGIVLYFDNISEGFCTYSSKESDNSSLRIVPKEFFDWVMNKIDNS